MHYQMIFLYLPHDLRFALLVFCLTVIVLWLLRIWRAYWVDAQEPPLLQYWIPWVGNAFSLLADFDGLILQAHKYFGNTKPFTIHLGGRKFYVLTNPNDVSEMFRSERSLTFHTFVEHVMTKGFDIPESTMNLMWKQSMGGQNDSPLMVSSHSFYKKQLLPGKAFNHTQAKIVKNICDYFRAGPDLTCYSTDPYHSSNAGLFLYDWCCEVLFNTVCSVHYGQLVVKRPTLWKTFADFDSGSWRAGLGLPRMVSRKTYRARDELVDAIEELLGGDLRELSDLVAFRAKDLQDGGIPARDVATFTTMVFWAMHTNAYRVSFWMLAFIIHASVQDDLIGTLRQETSAAFSSGNVLVDPSVLFDTKRCPILDAVHQETLRLTATTNSVRTVEEDVFIGGYRLRQGSSIMCPSSTTHMSEAVWGPNPLSFDHTRFLKNPKLRNYGGYRPFGGGSTYCPGRFQARQEVLALVMCFLQMYDVKTFGPPWIPSINTFSPAVGVREPICSGLFKVLVYRRANSKQS